MADDVSKYWWKYLSSSGSYVSKAENSSSTNTLITGNSGASIPIVYTSSFTIDQSTGKMMMTNPIQYRVPNGTPDATALNFIKYKYWVKGYLSNMPSSGYSSLNYTPGDATITRQKDGDYYYYYTSKNQVINTYFKDDIGDFTYISSDEPDTYGDGIIESTWYQRLYQPKVNFISSPIIELKKYTGSGKYGASNKNSIKLERKPKFMMILSMNTTSSRRIGFFVSDLSGAYCDGSRNLKLELSWDEEEKVLSWYNDSNAGYQLNEQNTEFVVVSFG